jgi:hypothetical protein
VALQSGTESLHEVTTTELDELVKECALAPSDGGLIAKLANGEMIAIEIKYPDSCQAHLYDHRHSLQRAHYQYISSNSSVRNSVLSIVLHSSLPTLPKCCQ